MKQDIDNIGRILDLADTPVIKPNLPVVQENNLPTLSEEKEQEDLGTARDHMLQNLDVTRDAISKLVQIVEESEDTRKFEVLNQFLKTNTDAAKNLVEIHRILNKSGAHENTASTNNIENAVFVGTTSDLHSLIRKTKQQNA